MAEKEYISREAANEACREAVRRCPSSFYNGIEAARDAIRQLPAADVRSVRRGKWERMSDNDVFGDINCKCSACGKDWWQGPGWFRNARFCPNCGAMMEES